MPYCEVAADVRLYYEEFGDGEPIVFVCGAQTTHKAWASQIAAFVDDYRTITFDWRGTGKSDKPREGYTTETAVGDIVELMQRLGAAPAAVVGHGLGAHLALILAEQRPELVRGLLLTGAAPWFSGERDGRIGGVSDEFLRFILEYGSNIDTPYAASCYELGDKWIFHHRQSPGMYQSVLEQALEWPQVVLNAYAASMRDIDHRQRAASIVCPVVVVQGRHDRKQRYEGGGHLAKMFMHGQLVTLEHSGTMTNVEEVGRFNAVLREFVRSLQPITKAA